MNSEPFYDTQDWLRPAVDLFPITPSDSVSQGNFRSLWVGTAGNIRLTTLRGTTVDIVNVPVGFLPVCGQRVWATGTTASGLLGAL
jgi:hypothetical protein